MCMNYSAASIGVFCLYGPLVCMSSLGVVALCLALYLLGPLVCTGPLFGTTFYLIGALLPLGDHNYINISGGGTVLMAHPWLRHCKYMKQFAKCLIKNEFT